MELMILLIVNSYSLLYKIYLINIIIKNIMERNKDVTSLVPAVTNKYEDNKDAVEKFSQRVTDLKKMNNQSYRPIEIMEENRTLFEAMIFPELSKGIKFPSQFMAIPTFTYHIKNSFTISTNSEGNCFVEFNFGQYLDESRYKDGIISKNWNSNIGNSNLFVCNDESLDGNTIVSEEATITKPNN